jgi:hypothetical protein
MSVVTVFRVDIGTFCKLIGSPVRLLGMGPEFRGENGLVLDAAEPDREGIGPPRDHGKKWLIR